MLFRLISLMSYTFVGLDHNEEAVPNYCHCVYVLVFITWVPQVN